MREKPIHVAVGVIVNDQRQILIAQRPADKTHGGCWEFPGGKIKTGESVAQALQRELQEELNLTVQQSRPLIVVHHAYPEYPVILDVRLVYAWSGEIRGLEGQAYQWVDCKALHNFHYPQANLGILSAIRLPETCFITPEPVEPADEYLGNIDRIL
ncbi:MAG: 8-oxo-dGTP diphosphatase MutT, partial [Thiotrichales bacterium]|nr:8-oxo-dGTP diphosphatase MutT [Thiotrichales bacterium]